jgi:hypothetical protein
MVLMKNSAKAFAPAGVCWVATTGITGGFSPGFAFGPVVGTSAGTLGLAGAVGGVLLTGVDPAVEVGAGSPEAVHPATSSTNTANAPICRTHR